MYRKHLRISQDYLRVKCLASVYFCMFFEPVGLQVIGSLIPHNFAFYVLQQLNLKNLGNHLKIRRFSGGIFIEKAKKKNNISNTITTES